jgi:hypothetical protein
MILEFRHELEALINKHNMEATSDTAGFILCQYLMDCLNAFDRAVIARQKWHGHKDEAPTPESRLKKGDYVLATKWHDGDPQDAWCIGFFDQMQGERFIVVDGEGKRFRYNGFRRAEAVTQQQGEWLLKNARLIETTDNGLWDYWIKRATESPLDWPALEEAKRAIQEHGKK